MISDAAARLASKTFLLDRVYRVMRFALVVLLGVALVGCGGQGPFKSVPVSGVVTYEDGTPIPVGGMKVFFHSQTPPKEGMHPRPAMVGVGADGRFENVTTYKYADGLVVGPHKVTLVAEEAGGKMSKKIPKDYADVRTTPLTVDVTKSGQVLEIKVPKP